VIEWATLRLGAYEILFGELDSAVIINEAIEITKAFGTEQSPKFINGVLDAVAKSKQ
jgi:transcription antitermination protein NusB